MSREVVAVLMDPGRLKAIIPAPAADRITNFIQSNGNARNHAPGSLSDTTLRNYLRQMKTAWSAYCSYSEKGLQRQFIEEVLPLLRRMSQKP